MAGIKPGFITGANCKIRLANMTVAYATDVSYNVDTLTVPVECMGRYEVLSNEPVSYGCNGTLSIIRYTKAAKTAGITSAATNGDAPARIGADSTMGKHINPAQMLQSTTFDLEVFQKLTNAGGTADVDTFYKIIDVRLTRRGATLNKRGVLVDTYTFVGVIATDTDVDTADVVGHSGIETDLS